MTIRNPIQHGAARLVGALGFSLAPRRFPLPTNTPGPMLTDGLWPMMTLGCGDDRLERVPSAQTIASPERMPRRPSLQLTSLPCRVQACAAAGPAGNSRYRGDGESRPPAFDRWSYRPPAGWLRAVIGRRRQPVSGSRREQWAKPLSTLRGRIVETIQSVGEMFADRGRAPLQNSPCTFKTGAPERWPSGLRRTLGKRVCGKPYRGFESHSLRHLHDFVRQPTILDYFMRDRARLGVNRRGVSTPIGTLTC